jgi:hypothetical protein
MTKNTTLDNNLLAVGHCFPNETAAVAARSSLGARVDTFEKHLE